jgi:hypothetical protein
VARDVPVALEIDGTVVEDRLDIVFEEPDGLVVVRLGPAADDRTPERSPETFAPALGRPVTAVLTLDLMEP